MKTTQKTLKNTDEEILFTDRSLLIKVAIVIFSSILTICAGHYAHII